MRRLYRKNSVMRIKKLYYIQYVSWLSNSVPILQQSLPKNHPKQSMRFRVLITGPSGFAPRSV
ncbi:hypothetical protein D1AOALGA4SA_10544 [Olavius algarvensis Delta 1 endosymbiont]|nr:hypothetical protein D1AOALGA4SA_10544 [Olavius algarvensis Delta 1 endosymbiont]